MTQKEARLILNDGAIKTLIEASDPDNNPAEYDSRYLKRVHKALTSLQIYLVKRARNKQRQPKGQNNGKTKRTKISKSKRVATLSRHSKIQS